MSEYVTDCFTRQVSPKGARSRAAAPAGEGSLVYTPISSRDQDLIQVFPDAFRVVRPGTGNSSATPPNRSGSTINGFSAKSQARLRFAALNAFPSISSTFALTYHNDWPRDGSICRYHRRLFLKRFARLLPSVDYLWLLEFQTRGAPHYHFYLTRQLTSSEQSILAHAWVEITNGSPEALWWHSRPENFRPWVVNSGSYLCKYLDKEAQKVIPDSYLQNFGRFWGHSSKLVPDPVTVPAVSLSAYDQINPVSGELQEGQVFIIRTLGRLSDLKSKGYSRFRVQAQRSSYTMHGGAAAFWRLERYLAKTRGKEVKP